MFSKLRAHNTQYSYYVSHSNGPKYVSQTQPMTVFPINLCFDDVTYTDGEEKDYKHDDLDRIAMFTC